MSELTSNYVGLVSAAIHGFLARQRAEISHFLQLRHQRTDNSDIVTHFCGFFGGMVFKLALIFSIWPKIPDMVVA